MSRASHKGSGERGTFHTWWVKQLFDIFVKKGDNWYVIMGDNHCFILRDLVLIELFQISHNCVTECMLQAKVLLKLVLKLIKIPFFPTCGIYQYVIFLSNIRGKFKLLGLQGNPPPQFPRLVGHPDLPMRKILKVVWSAYCNDFLSKQKKLQYEDEKEEAIFKKGNIWK